MKLMEWIAKQERECSEMFKLTALGAGSAFTMKNWQTNFLIETVLGGDPRYPFLMLVDCGTDIRFSLNDFDLLAKDIDAVYISHAHADHIGGLEWLGFMNFFNPSYNRGVSPPNTHYQNKNQPLLYAESRLCADLWAHSLKGGMEGLEGEDATLDHYFRVCSIKRNQQFEWSHVKFNMVQAVHISAGYALMDSYGLMFTTPGGKRIYLTTDVQFAPETSMKAYYQEADIIIHDCETGPYQSGVHSHYDQLRTLPMDIKKKMRLIHYQDNVVDDWIGWAEKAREDNFMGFVRKGEIIYEED